MDTLSRRKHGTASGGAKLLLLGVNHRLGLYEEILRRGKYLKRTAQRSTEVFESINLAGPCLRLHSTLCEEKNLKDK